jgi:hypothetical protein
MRGTSGRWIGAVAAVVLAVPVATAQGHPADWSNIAAHAGPGAPPGIATFNARQTAELPGSFTEIGHEPLMGRGMNAAIAVHKNYVYIGSRTDADNGNANHAGVFVVDAKNPAQPKIVHEFEGFSNESSRELRTWRSKDLLIVLHTNCGGATAHGCTQPNRSSMRFYDIAGEYAAAPRLLYQNTRDTHEFFIWEDPKNPDRALMYAASAGNGNSAMQVFDISPVLQCRQWTEPTPCTHAPTILFNGPHGYPSQGGNGIHSFSVSNDGRRAYFALLGGGFAVTDMSDFADANPATNQYRQITTAANRPRWPGPGAHSAVKLWNQDYVYVSDEVYGSITAAGHGCPWGWARFINIDSETRPLIQGEFRLPENQPFNCSVFDGPPPEGTPRPRTSFSAHNPTLTPSIAFSTWHSSGFVAMDVTNPTNVTPLAQYKPDPLAMVGMEDPRLSSDDQKVVMWSYPVIQDGLIYVVDLRNGLYILKYNGPYEHEVNSVSFLEGNSNQGDALCYEPVAGAVVQPDCSAAVDEDTTAGGTVPATLSLSLGGPASFGAFTPGVARDYLASTTANVISTAGDAALSVADASSVATGHLVNGSFSLPQAVQARATNAANTGTAFAAVGGSSSPTTLLTYGGPISNDAVTLEFKQAIGANDALRTGAYSKVLTFTLSTTNP